jgi:hypothetical protein
MTTTRPQRLGIVASIAWLTVATPWRVISDLRSAKGYATEGMSGCIAIGRSYIGSDGTVTMKGADVMAQCQSAVDVAHADMLHHLPLDAIAFAGLPLLAGWAIGYIALKICRWVAKGA